MFGSWKALLIGLCALLVPGAANATGFDCSKATARDERAVCGNAQLSALDSEMTGLWYAYSRVPMAMGGSGQRRDDEQAFLARRRQCGGDVNCLTRAYTDRIAQLRGGVGGWMQTMQVFMLGAPPPAPADNLPGPVMQSIAGYPQQCASAGGTLTNAGNVLLLAGDVDGDGSFDYVVNPQSLDCRGAATALCANDGCDIWLHLSRSQYVNPVNIRGGQPTLVQRDGHTDLEIWASRFNCNAAPGTPCWAVYSWKDGKLSSRYRTGSDDGGS